MLTKEYRLKLPYMHSSQAAKYTQIITNTLFSIADQPVYICDNLPNVGAMPNIIGKVVSVASNDITFESLQNQVPECKITAVGEHLDIHASELEVVFKTIVNIIDGQPVKELAISHLVEKRVDKSHL